MPDPGLDPLTESAEQESERKLWAQIGDLIAQSSANVGLSASEYVDRVLDHWGIEHAPGEFDDLVNLALRASFEEFRRSRNA